MTLLQRYGRIALTLAVLGVVTFQFGRVLREERTTTGGELSLPLDDSFIYLQYGRAIAEGHPFVYTPGNKPTTGATSLWYPLLLAPPHALRLGPEICVLWALALGVLGYALSALLIARLGGRLGGPVGGGIALTLFLANPKLLWGYWSGMEIALYGTVLLATALSYVSERAEGRFPRTRWWLLALAGARPEGALLCAVFAALLLRDHARAARAAGPVPGRRFPAAAAVALGAAAIPFAVNFLVSGSIESTGSQAKSMLAEPYAETRAKMLAETPTVVSGVGQVFLSQLETDERSLPIRPLVPATAGGLVLFAALSFVPPRRPWPGGASLLWLVAAGTVIGSIPVAWYVHYFRYQQGLMPLILALVGAGWGRLAWLAWEARRAWLGRPAAVAASVLPLATTLPLLVPSNSAIIRLYALNCENILHQQVRVGRWIDANLPKDAIVGLNDAGAIAYYGRRSTLDLIGLTSAGFAKVYRSGLGCLFEEIRRLPSKRLPTYFAIYPEWFPYWQESGILGPEAFRARLALNTICGGTDKVVYPASWIDVRPTDAPALDSAELHAKRRVDTLDLAWLEDERRHEWRGEPEATDVLRRYAYADRMNRPTTDGGRIVRGGERFRASVEPGRDLVLVMRTDAWYPVALDVSVDGASAGTWSIALSESVWVEPRFTIPGALLTRDRPEIAIRRRTDASGAAAGGNYAPFHYWLYQ